MILNLKKVFVIKKIFYSLFLLNIIFTNSLYAENFRIKKVAFLTIPSLENSALDLSQNSTTESSINSVQNSKIENSKNQNNELNKNQNSNSTEQKNIINSVQQNFQTEAYVGINDSLCIKLPDDLTFIQGIELNIKIPNKIAQWPNTIIYTLYDNVNPTPTEKTIDFTGTELFTGVYPGALSITIQIPIMRGNTIKKTPYAEKTLIPDTSRKFIFIRNQLAMKGIPNEVYKENFIVSAKPILVNKGRLFVKVNNDFFNKNESSNLSISIDDKIVELDKNSSIMIKPGAHTVSIFGDDVRNETISCFIEAAKNSTIEFNLQDTTPQIFVTMPEGTQIFADEEELFVNENQFSLTPGEHSLKFLLGGYEIIKNIMIQEGRSYSIDITFDANIKEN